MQSKAKTVDEYLKDLPEDRRAALNAVREAIKKHLDKDIEEGMTYGMIGYYIPHRVYPKGYHCDPKMPLPYAGLASQKSHMSLYLMGCYGSAELNAWFTDAWKKTGKKLDMGKACVRFKKIEDVPLDVVSEVIRRLPAKTYIAHFDDVLADQANRRAAKKSAAKKTAPKKSAATKPTPKKVAKKSAAKRKG